ncbi:MAG: hypothetical protein JXR25_01070 [Pontiellaceae bacterium]|nr:hypothetical protein [Pontiellaceae bacterium]MBN2783390.1 hypothetical protein [Pontiellaceae bacterium]
MEVILVIVLITIISAISTPFFANSLNGTKLKTASRSIERMARFTRNMAIMRNETLTLAIDNDTMELFMGAPANSETNTTDGYLDQEVLKRLGYVDGTASDSQNAGLSKEHHFYLPEGLVVNDFEKEWNDEDHLYDNFCLVHFYPNGQCEWFKLELMDSRDNAIRMEIDPVSGKIWSEYVQ